MYVVEIYAKEYFFNLQMYFYPQKDICYKMQGTFDIGFKFQNIFKPLIR